MFLFSTTFSGLLLSGPPCITCIISLLIRAAKLIIDSKDFKKEKEMLRRALEDNNYPNWLIKKTFKRFKCSKIEKQEKSKNYKGIVILPYLQEITENLNRIITKYQSICITSSNN